MALQIRHHASLRPSRLAHLRQRPGRPLAFRRVLAMALAANDLRRMLRRPLNFVPLELAGFSARRCIAGAFRCACLSECAYWD